MQNDWHIVDIHQVGKDEKAMEEDEAEAFHDILHHVGSAVAESVEVGNIGAVTTSEDKEAPNGYYLVEFIDTPGPGENGLECKVLWLDVIKGAPKWFTKSEVEGVVDMINVVHTDVKMDPVSPSNQLPRWVSNQITNQIAVKISEDSHNFILDEIIRREALEYDHSLVYVGDETDEEN